MSSANKPPTKPILQAIAEKRELVWTYDRESLELQLLAITGRHENGSERTRLLWRSVDQADALLMDRRIRVHCAEDCGDTLTKAMEWQINHRTEPHRL